MAEAEAETKFDNPMVDPEDPPAKPPTTAGAKEYVPPARRERAAPFLRKKETIPSLIGLRRREEEKPRVHIQRHQWARPGSKFGVLLFFKQ